MHSIEIDFKFLLYSFGIPMHHFNSLKFILMHAVLYFHISMTTRATHAYIEQINKNIVRSLPRKLLVPTPTVRFQKHAIMAFFRCAGARTTTVAYITTIESDPTLHLEHVILTLDADEMTKK